MPAWLFIVAAAVCWALPFRPPDEVLERALGERQKDLAWFQALPEKEQERVLLEMFPHGWPPKYVLSPDGPPAPSTLRMRKPAIPVPKLVIEPPASLSGAGVDLKSAEAARLRLDSTFDASQVPPTVSVIPEWEGLRHELWIQNMQLRRFRLRDPNLRFSAEVGQLGVLPRNELLGRSWYWNLRKGFEWEGSVLDGNLELQFGGVQLQSRFFYDDAPELDSRTDLTLEAGGTLARTFGLPGHRIDEFKEKLTFDTRWETKHVYVGSALGQVGRAWTLWGPVDLAVVAGGIARVTDRFPNVALDQSAALRYRVLPSLSFAVTGGVSEGLGLFGPTFWKDSIAAEKAKVNVHVDAAPHVGAAVFGHIPKLPGGQYLASVQHQFLPLTQRTETAARTSMSFGKDMGLSLTGRYERESGKAIEFMRNRGGLEIGFSPGGGLELFGGGFRDTAHYGGASVSNDSLMFGLRGSDERGKHPQELRLESIIGGKDKLMLPKSQALGVIEDLRGLSEFFGGMWDMHGDSAKKGWNEMRDAYWGLPPDVRARIQEEVSRRRPGLPPLDEVFGTDPNSLPISSTLNTLTALLDSEMYERVVIRYVRNLALEEIRKEPIDLWGNEKIQLSAPVVLALAHAYSLSLSPVPPITSKDARESLDPFLFKELKQYIGTCPDAASEAQLTDCLLGKLPEPVATQLKNRYGDRLSEVLRETIQWHSDVIRREINRTILQLILAAEALNELTVDGGRRLSSLNQDWLVRSFERLDKRKRGLVATRLKNARQALEEQMKQEDETIRLKLRWYGQARLESLKNDGLNVEVRTEDWPALLAFYGDELIDFLRAAGRRPPAKRLIIQYDAVMGIGTVVSTTDESVTVKLGPLGPNGKAGTTLESLRKSLGR